MCVILPQITVSVTMIALTNTVNLAPLTRNSLVTTNVVVWRSPTAVAAKCSVHVLFRPVCATNSTDVKTLSLTSSAQVIAPVACSVSLLRCLLCPVPVRHHLSWTQVRINSMINTCLSKISAWMILFVVLALFLLQSVQLVRQFNKEINISRIFRLAISQKQIVSIKMILSE